MKAERLTLPKDAELGSLFPSREHHLPLSTKAREEGVDLVDQ